MRMLRLFYVQIRRGGFSHPAPWGEKSSPFHTLQGAKDHVRGCQELADHQNCVIDYIISDETGNIVEQG